jgi:putative tryptophan/tyrosine transport system substrate-binding protein
MMKRRDFITLVGSAAARPLAARAQQPAQVRRVGVLIGYAENDPETQARLLAFRQGLDHLG